jgi:hypothetical protein
MGNKLERIFFREGKFINMENKEVDPKQIGESVTVVINPLTNYEGIPMEVKDVLSSSHRKYASEINAYTFGIGKRQDNFDIYNKLEHTPLTFFKI